VRTGCKGEHTGAVYRHAQLARGGELRVPYNLSVIGNNIIGKKP
jgi:hypothetical protein